MKIRYCTLFDSRYMTRGFTMLASLSPYLREGDEVVALALDDQVLRAFEKSNFKNVTAIGVESLQDDELLALRATRPRREFCWTCTPALAAWMVNSSADGDIVVYVDADLLFFADPGVLLDELSDGGNILIHEHRFSPDKAKLLENGRFNVGFVAFRVGDEARACVARWRAQTIARCELDQANGYCGDQGYLNEWPALYPGVRIMQNLGGGVAPWNVNQYEIGESAVVPTVDGHPLVFYHYHALQTITTTGTDLAAVNPALDYSFARETLDLIYRPYAKLIKQTHDGIAGQGFKIAADRARRRLYVRLASALGWFVPSA